MNEHISDHMSAWLDGMLPEVAARRAEAHVATCERCRAEAAEFQSMKSRLQTLSRNAAPPSLMRTLNHAFLDAPAPSRFWPTIRAAFSWRPVSAFAAVAVAAGFLYFRLGPSDSMDPQLLIAAHMRYQAESLVPNADPAHSNLSAQLVKYYDED